MERDVLNKQVNVGVLARVFYPWVRSQIDQRQGVDQVLLLEAPKKRVVGFDPVGEVDYLGRVDCLVRSGVLVRELATQTAEDLGLVEHVGHYDLRDGKISDRLSGESLVEMTKRGGVTDEVMALEKIEKGLVEGGGVWVHFSPVNEELGYQFNCVDFWRVVDGEVVSVRLMVKNGEAEMRNVWKLINNGVGLGVDEKLLTNPVVSEKLKLTKLFDMVELVAKKTGVNFEEIDRVAQQVIEYLRKEKGERLFEDPELILRAYTMVHEFLKPGVVVESSGLVGMIAENYLRYYAVAPMNGVKQIRSYGCAGSSTVGNFASGEGWIIRNLGGKYVVQKGSTEGKTFCKDCGCWYEGSKCPFCSKGD
ncbi:MAG: hypothetical protein WCV93_01705 [Candidatus Shapirobacteria bacterium]|jgi:hypothetical protein